MYAIIKTGGKQYKVAQGDVLRVEKLENNPGDKLKFDALMFSDGTTAVVGTPEVSGVSVSATVVQQGKGAKIMIYKYKAKKNVRKKQGHRQSFTEIKIDSIKK